jgi:pyruvate dehydrogenase (quinone)
MANAAPNAFGAQLAYPGRQTIALGGDGGFTMLGMGDLLTQVERKTPVIHLLLNNGSLDFVNIEQQEAGYIPYGVGFKNPNFACPIPMEHSSMDKARDTDLEHLRAG